MSASARGMMALTTHANLTDKRAAASHTLAPWALEHRAAALVSDIIAALDHRATECGQHFSASEFLRSVEREVSA